jgi:hypothetical protein
VDLEMYGLQKREQMKQDDRNEKCMIVAENKPQRNDKV